MALGLVALVSFPTWARISHQQCSTVDLREPGESFYQVPQYDQGDSEYCWGFTGTQALTAILQRENQRREKPLPIDEVALSATAVLHEFSRSGKCQTYCDLFNHSIYLKSGCSLKDVSVRHGSEMFQPDLNLPILNRSCHKISSYTIKDFESEFQSILKKALVTESSSQRGKAKSHDRVLFESLRQRKAHSDPKRERNHWIGFSKLYAQGELRENEAVLLTVAPQCYEFKNGKINLSGSPSVRRLLSSIQQKPKCENVRIPEFNQAVQTLFQNGDNKCASPSKVKVMADQDLVKGVHQQLSGPHALPVPVDYCYTFLYEGEASGPKFPCQNRAGEPRMDHKSLIIGRRWNAEQRTCEFLLRNTLGKDCSSLHARFRPDCEKSQKSYGTSDIYIPEDLLSQVLHGYGSIK